MTYVSFRRLFFKLRKEERHTDRSLQANYVNIFFSGCLIRFETPLFAQRLGKVQPSVWTVGTPVPGNVTKLRNPCHSEAAQQPWESVSKWYYGLPRPLRFAQGARNDILNWMTLPSPVWRNTKPGPFIVNKWCFCRLLVAKATNI